MGEENGMDWMFYDTPAQRQIGYWGYYVIIKSTTEFGDSALLTPPPPPPHTHTASDACVFFFLRLLLLLLLLLLFLLLLLLSKEAGRSSEVERSLMVRWVVGSILHGVDPLRYFSFQPVLHDWCNKGRGMC